METPHYHIRRLRIDEYEAEADVPSYEIDLVEDEEEEERKPSQPTPASAEAEKPVIGPLTHAAAPPAPPKPVAAGNGGGFIKKIITGLFGKKEPETEKKPATTPEARQMRQHQPGRGHGGGRPPHRPPHGQRHERHERHGHPDRRPGGQEQGRPRPPQPQQAAGAPGGEAGQAQRERPEGGSGRRRRRGRRRGGRSQEGRAPQERQDQTYGKTSERSEQGYVNASNAAPEANGSPDRPAPAPRPPREETSYVPPAAATAGVTETFAETPPAASSWDKPSEQNNDGWHTPSAPTSGHDETHHASDSGESAPKPELVQVETRFDDDDKGNK